MFKSLVVLAAVSTMSGPVLAQTAPAQSGTTAPAKPQTVKKRVCYQEEEDSYSRLGGRTICKTVEVPAPAANATSQPAPAQANTQGK